MVPISKYLCRGLVWILIWQVLTLADSNKMSKKIGFYLNGLTPVITLFISGLKSRVLKLSFLSFKMMVKTGLEFILKLTEPLQSCCCPVQKFLPRLAELAWQLSRYLWRGSVNFKINSRPLFTVIFKLKNDKFLTRDFSPLIERFLTGVCNAAVIF